ncbi:ABC-type dipeptide/oligopeptide/nickel transport system, permease component (plasmid) [Ketogulonicigenium vulgare Y25]|uniref:ABC-type dipeptide/oligopeptide/nickel transport system, permease component n=1 Tax=Ketogulonicigenium vulgare (strain WSH-001) TaxID=759362 RepID=F9YBS2_KETVW|nr:ABC transporter permease [Ketogulonicigenium vulgare]ADO44389.1 ABC-type dipeptide/oligopeptide/nickel transport system, permease component [Ketogulonicigenium vulgare Y25]AEM42824.1 ABC-type dipeptide/oligopeptide/nickel transport system, permease component [Ketogulonicigenium vulgare WSH-001]ALJ82747.1 ABC transporter permease [Ketogulonicigenium vulgare]
MQPAIENAPRKALPDLSQGKLNSGLWPRFMRGINTFLSVPRQNAYAMIGLIIYAIFILTAVFADVLMTHRPLEILFTDSYQLARNIAPGPEHLLGTTYGGRDIYSQLVIGTRSALLVGVTAAVCVVAIGTVVGLISGYFGGWADNLLMRLSDIALGIPFLPFVIVLASFLGASQMNVIIGIALLLWPNSARVIRSQVMSLRERAFIEAARVTGAGQWKILFVHIAPNVLSLAFLYTSVAVGWAILTEASVSFLGFGPSNTVSWGYMLQDAYASQALGRGQYNWFVPPGLCIVLVVMAGFFISRGFEEVLFPKLKG